MATAHLNTPPITRIAGADLSAKDGFFGKIDSAGEVVLCGAGEVGIPILLGAEEDKPVALYTIGSIAKMKAGSAINAGAKIKSDGDGKAEDATATSVSSADVLGSNVLGIAMSTVANEDEIVEVLYIPMGALVTTPS